MAEAVGSALCFAFVESALAGNAFLYVPRFSNP